jgi:hypothetical protein
LPPRPVCCHSRLHFRSLWVGLRTAAVSRCRVFSAAFGAFLARGAQESCPRGQPGFSTSVATWCFADEKTCRKGRVAPGAQESRLRCHETVECRAGPWGTIIVLRGPREGDVLTAWPLEHDFRASGASRRATGPPPSRPAGGRALDAAPAPAVPAPRRRPRARLDGEPQELSRRPSRALWPGEQLRFVSAVCGEGD